MQVKITVFGDAFSWESFPEINGSWVKKLFHFNLPVTSEIRKGMSVVRNNVRAMPCPSRER